MKDDLRTASGQVSRGGLQRAPIDALPSNAAAALDDARAALRAHYGDRLGGLVLYGSYARGDARPGSDLDLLVLLRGEVNALAELRALGALMIRLAAEHGEEVALQVYPEEGFAAGASSFLRNVREEGVLV